MRLDQEDTQAFNTLFKSGRFSQSTRVLSTNIDITHNGSIVNVFDPNGGTYTVRLPPLQPGRFYVITNSGTSGTLNVVDNLGVAITTLDPGSSTMLFAGDDTWTGVAGSMDLDVFGPVGPGHSTGLVPDPGIGPASSPHKYLSETGVWETVAGLVASNAYFYGHKGGAVTVLPVGSETLEFLSANTAITILGQSGTSPKSMLFTLNAANINHNALLNYVADQHVAHSGVTLTAGLGLSGGGTIAASRTFDFDPSELTVATPTSADHILWSTVAAGAPRRTLISTLNGLIDHNALLNYSVNRHIDHSAVSIVASTGLSGGGDLTTSRSLALDINALPTETPSSLDLIALYDVSGFDTNKCTIGNLSPAINHNALENYVPNEHINHTTVSIATTEGIQGGGTIAATRTLKLDINGLAAEAAVSAADYGVIYDVSSGLHKKALLSDWPGSGGGISDAPVDGKQYARRDAAWSEVVSAGGATLHKYTYNTTLVPAPASGNFRMNNATQSSVTTIWLHYTNGDLIDTRNYFLQKVKIGDTFYIQDRDVSSKWQLYELTGAFTDNTTYVTMPVTWRAGGSALTAGQQVVIREPASVNSPIGEAPVDNDTYGRENAAWKKIPTITVASSAPGSPATGDVWIDTT